MKEEKNQLNLQDKKPNLKPYEKPIVEQIMATSTLSGLDLSSAENTFQYPDS